MPGGTPLPCALRVADFPTAGDAGDPKFSPTPRNLAIRIAVHALPSWQAGCFMNWGAPVNGREIYFHRNSVIDGDFARFEIGTEVSFAEELGDKGPQATTVRPHKKRHARPTVGVEGA